MVRLTINIDEDLHKQLKIAAAKRGITMTDFILQLVIARLEQDKRYE